MAIQGIFAHDDLIGAAMQAAVVRNDVISNNIANAETPGYKKRDVMFESMMRSAVDDYRSGKAVNFDDLRPIIKQDDSMFDYRIDENNVDIEKEMVDLYETSVKYDVMANGLINNYKRINAVIQGIR